MNRFFRDVPALRQLRLPLALTRIGMVAEAVTRAFWPFATVVMAVLAPLMLGVHDYLSVEVVWVSAVVGLLALLVTFVRGAMRMRWPSGAEALARIDATMPGRPIQALLDEQAIGTGDEASEALWEAHQARMAARAAEAKPAAPDLKLSRFDPFALRYVATVAFAVAVIFGSLLRVGSVAEMTPGAASAAGGPTWEGWVEPPRYTGLPTLYLADIDGEELQVAEGARITLRLYGEIGALTLSETVSGRTGDVPSAADPEQEFEVTQAGELRIDGPGGRVWDVAMVEDMLPQVSVSGDIESDAMGRLSLPFSASDDYGVVAGRVEISLDVDALDRRHGLAAAPEPRDALTADLPMPISGDRRLFSETMIEDFSEHPWANLPVIFKLSAEDAKGQNAEAEAYHGVLAARRFFDPLAAAVAEQRRDLLWTRDNARRVAMILRAISHRPEDAFRSETAYLRLRVILRRLETFTQFGLTAVQRDEIAEALWDLAILLEEGDLGDALERLRRAQERLAEAMKNGASDREIAELMQELREATDDYLRQLSRQAQQNGENGEDRPDGSQDSMQMSQNDLQRMMDRIQELMEQGRMAEAEQALRELQELMENMRVTQGQGQGSEGQRAMEGLAETLREQQGLSDEAFRDLQDQFNPGQGQGQGQPGQQQPGAQGDGQQQGQPGPRQGQNQGQGSQPGGEPDAQTLADRQQALRDELRRQQGRLPGQGTPEGDAAREALDRAGRAMEGAEDALRDDDLAEAIDQQSEAMEALREGMRSLGEAMAQAQQDQQGQGSTEGDMASRNRDPLGRNQGSNGTIGTDDGMLQGEDVYRRARELLDEIRKRSGEGERPEIELEYLRRLLERF